jgi:hypothetical protein
MARPVESSVPPTFGDALTNLYIYLLCDKAPIKRGILSTVAIVPAMKPLESQNV